MHPQEAAALASLLARQQMAIMAAEAEINRLNAELAKRDSYAETQAQKAEEDRF